MTTSAGRRSKRILIPATGHAFFASRTTPRAVVDSWRHADGDEYQLHAWVVMPNHVHVLVEPLSAQKIGDIVGAWKSVSARKILRCITANAAGLTYSEATGGGRGPIQMHEKRYVWQFDYYDRFIRSERHYRAAVDYIHQNPVKAGLIGKAENWPWSSAASWSGDCGRLG